MRQWGASAKKMVFPYERYSRIEELKQETVFPPYESFYSSLRGNNIDRQDYEQALSEFNRRRALPDSCPEKYFTMADYLKVSCAVTFSNLISRLTTCAMLCHISKQKEIRSTTFKNTLVSTCQCISPCRRLRLMHFFK